ncbi:OmpH family outer membrane protein [Candidatus Poribacteria bacterium]|nr:OmpH family outer membrane protein [Candidatus Poribacteria bacterium]
MKRYVLILCSIMLFSMLSGSIGQESFKFGVVDTQFVLDNYGKFKDANEILQTADKRLRDKLEGLVGEIRTLQEKLTKTELFLEKPQTEELQNQIKTKEDEFLRERQTGEQALMDKQKELMEPILKEIEDLIKKVGKEQNYDLIISKQAALYFNEEFDITQSLIDTINRTPVENNVDKVPEKE